MPLVLQLPCCIYHPDSLRQVTVLAGMMELLGMLDGELTHGTTAPNDEESSRCNGNEMEDMAGVGLVGGTSPVVVVVVVVAAAHGRVEYSENAH